MVSVSIANGSGGCAVATIARPSGLPLSALLTESVSRDSDTLTPSLTVAIAAFRVASVIRLTVPRWSSLPQRFQVDSSVIQRSIVAASSGPAVDDDPGDVGDCATAIADRAEATTKDRAEIDTTVRRRTMD